MEVVETMNRYDINIGKVLSKEEIRSALSEILSVSESRILVVEEITGLEDLANIVMFCEYDVRGGEFPTHLGVINKSKNQGIGSEKEFALRMAMHFHCRTIIIEESHNPYIWRVIDKDGKITRVLVDDEKLDEYEEFLILRSMEEPDDL